MIVSHLALVSEAPEISLAHLTPVAAAIQKQLTRDFGPIWGIQATIDCFPNLQTVPPGYWSITIKANFPNSAQSGIHQDTAGQPFALVPAAPNWKLSVSHEALEMLADPLGQRTVAGQSPLIGQGRVNFLVEVCDPCQAFSYAINGEAVSDFFTPNYFDPVGNSSVRYSYTGAIKAPRQVLKGGYLSWHDPVSGHWFRQSLFGSQPRIIDLGPLQHGPTMNFRSLIYAKTPEAFRARKPNLKTAKHLRAAQAAVENASRSKARSLRKQIKEILGRE